MPDRYDKAVCATELRLRGKISTQIRAGWRPNDSSQVAIPAEEQNAPDIDVNSDTSETPTVSLVRGHRVNDITNLGDF